VIVMQPAPHWSIFRRSGHRVGAENATNTEKPA
jgi:hypothetical protein